MASGRPQLQSVLCGFRVGWGGGLFCLSDHPEGNLHQFHFCTCFSMFSLSAGFFFLNIILAGPGPLMVPLSEWFARSSDGASSVFFFIYDIKRITENNFVAQHQWYIFRLLER